MGHRAYICFADADRKFRDALVMHLSALMTSGKLAVDDATNVSFVGDPLDERLAALGDADAILMLLSAKFLEPDPVRNEERRRAAERNAQERTPFIPIQLTECDLSDTEYQGRRILPGDRPVGAPGNDKAWTDIVKELRKVLERLPPRPSPVPPLANPVAPQPGQPQTSGLQGSEDEEVPTLTTDELQALADAAVTCSLQRNTLVLGIPRELLGNIQVTVDTPAAGLLSDLNALNGLDRLPDGNLPLMIWVKNAIHFTKLRREQKIFLAARMKLESPAQKRETPPEPKAPQKAGPQDPKTSPVQAGAWPEKGPTPRPPATGAGGGILDGGGATTGGLNLKGKQVGQLCKALESAFPSLPKLKKMTRIELDLKLDTILTSHSLEDAVFDLVSWAEEKSRVDDLLRGALADNPTNTYLQRIANEVLLTSDAVPSQWLFRKLESLVVKGVPFANVVEWRGKMALAEQTVCRIEHDKGAGTGFLVGPRYVMTNYHVAHALKSSAGKFLFDFKLDVESKGKGTRVVTTTAMQPKAESPADKLDYAILDLGEPIGDEPVFEGGPKRQFLRPVAHPFEIAEPLMILQHPGGDLLKVCSGSVVAVPPPDATEVSYTVNTLSGSSGSPVFSFVWDLVALHCGARDTANLGIPMSAILADLKSSGKLGLLEASVTQTSA